MLPSRNEIVTEVILWREHAFVLSHQLQLGSTGIPCWRCGLVKKLSVPRYRLKTLQPRRTHHGLRSLVGQLIDLLPRTGQPHSALRQHQGTHQEGARRGRRCDGRKRCEFLQIEETMMVHE